MIISNDIRRKWNRMGTLLKLYVRIFTLVFVAIFVLSLDKLSRKRKSFEHRTTLDQRIQERIQKGRKSTLTLKGGGGRWNQSIGQEIACHFSQDHTI